MITLGLVDSVDTNGVYVTMPGSRGLLRGPYKALSTVAAGTTVLVASTDDGEQVVVGAVNSGDGALNVRAFGAVGDGVADDTEAIQAALDAASPGGRVKIPAGNYRTTSTLYIRERVTIEGALGALMWGNSAITLDTEDDIVALHVGREDSSEIWDVRIYGLSVARKTFDTDDGAANTECTGIYLDHVSEGRFVEVSSAGFRAGWDFDCVSICEFDYCKSYYCQYGIWMGLTAPAGGSPSRSQSVSNAFRSWNLWRCGTGVILGGSVQAQFDGCHVESCSVATFAFPDLAVPYEAWGVSIRGCNLRNYVSGAPILAMVAPTSPAMLFVRQFAFEDSLLQVYDTASAIELSGAGAAYREVAVALVDCYVRGCTTSAASSSTAMTLRHGGQNLIRANADGSGADMPLASGSVSTQNSVVQSKPSVTGSRGSNAALQSLLTALSDLGLITDSSS